MQKTWLTWKNEYAPSWFERPPPLVEAPPWSKKHEVPWINFFVGFGGPIPLEACEVATPFPRQKWQKRRKISIITWIYHHQSINNSLLSSHKNFQPDWPRLVESGPKNLCPNMGMCAFLLCQISIFLNETNVSWFVSTDTYWLWFIASFMLKRLIYCND